MKKHVVRKNPLGSYVIIDPKGRIVGTFKWKDDAKAEADRRNIEEPNGRP